VDGESGESLIVEAVGAGTDQPGDKAFYKAQTGAKKYALTQAFLIATGDDPEDEQAPKTSKAKQSARAAQQEPSEPRQTPSVAPQSTQAPEDEGQAVLTNLPEELANKALMITSRKKIKEAHKQHPKVVDGSIQQMTWAELQAEWPEETR
jgi:hypothetical protein